MNAQKRKAVSQERRRNRVRRAVRGTAARPRLTVFRSSKHIYVQLIDDDLGRTVASASTTEPSVRGSETGANVSAATRVGQAVAERAKAAGVSKVVYDRGGYKYHGRVAAVAEAARAAGLEF